MVKLGNEFLMHASCGVTFCTFAIFASFRGDDASWLFGAVRIFRGNCSFSLKGTLTTSVYGIYHFMPNFISCYWCFCGNFGRNEYIEPQIMFTKMKLIDWLIDWINLVICWMSIYDEIDVEFYFEFVIFQFWSLGTFNWHQILAQLDMRKALNSSIFNAKI